MDEVLDILKIIAALGNIAFGAFTLVRPSIVAEASGFQLQGKRGVTELRVAFGGFFIGLGIAILLFDAPDAARVGGLAYLGSAIVRLVEFVVGPREELVRPMFWGIWATEILMGIILVL